jgi:hypothetical protein
MAELTHKTVGTVGSAPVRDIVPPQAIHEPQDRQQPAEEAVSPVDLRALIELGRISDSITLGGMTFELETLDDKEQEDILKLTDGGLSADSFVTIRRIVVAKAVQSVNGRPLEALSSAEGDGFQRKLSIVTAMQSHVVERLYEFYEQLVARSKGAIEPEQVKN